MTKLIPATAVASLFAATAVLAGQPSPAPTTTETAPPSAAVESATPPVAPPEKMESALPTDAQVMSAEQEKAWINKVVYSSDDKNVGEVAAFARDSSGKVIEMHADIGGFLGLGETRVRILPSDYTLAGDRVLLKVTAEQAKSFPKIALN